MKALCSFREFTKYSNARPVYWKVLLIMEWWKRKRPEEKNIGALFLVKN
jgi:hypothetical protein